MGFTDSKYLEYTFVDLRMILPSPPIQVTAFTALQSTLHPVAPVDTVHSSIKCADGLIGSFSLGYSSPFSKSQLVLAGSEKTLLFNLQDEVILLDTEGKMVEALTVEGHGPVNALELFVRKVLDGADVGQELSLQEAMNDVIFVEKCIASGEQNGTPQSFDFVDSNET